MQQYPDRVVSSPPSRNIGFVRKVRRSITGTVEGVEGDSQDCYPQGPPAEMWRGARESLTQERKRT